VFPSGGVRTPLWTISTFQGTYGNVFCTSAQTEVSRLPYNGWEN
jgi:hypothetical protein